MDLSNASVWKKCSSCKKPILFNTTYYECNVSTCNGERTGYVFCSVMCFEVHLPGARHRSAGAVERKSPSAGSQTQATQTQAGPKRILVSAQASSAGASGAAMSSAEVKNFRRSPMENEVLVVVSKMKQYIKDVADMNTSDEVSQTLSGMIRIQLDRAIENARADGRKTVMSRDFKV